MYSDILTKTGLFGKFGQKPGSETLQLLFIGAILVLVALGAFGLGRLSGLSEGRGHFKIYAPETQGNPQSGTAAPSALVDNTSQLATPVAAVGKTTGTSSSQTEPAHNFVASKNGSKYYSSGCSGASRIKVANQVWFASAADAESAGYTLASGCK